MTDDDPRIIPRTPREKFDVGDLISWSSPNVDDEYMIVTDLREYNSSPVLRVFALWGSGYKAGEVFDVYASSVYLVSRISELTVGGEH